MRYDLHTERVNIGYDGINPINEIIDTTKQYTDEFSVFFNEYEEEHYLTLQQELLPDHKSIRYYLEIQMKHDMLTTFVLYFGDKYNLQ